MKVLCSVSTLIWLIFWTLLTGVVVGVVLGQSPSPVDSGFGLDHYQVLCSPAQIVHDSANTSAAAP